MAELSWSDILADRTRYPDSMTWPLDDGSTVTLGALRGAVVPQQTATQTERQYQERMQALEREKAYLQEMVTQRAAGPEPTTTPPQTYDYGNDPLFKPLWERANSAYDYSVQNQQTLKAMQQLQAQIAATLQQIPVVLKVQQLQQRDPQLNTEQFFQFAKEKGFTPNQYDDAYKLLTYDQQMAKAREEAAAAAVEQAKGEWQQQMQVPYSAYGPPHLEATQEQRYGLTPALDKAILNDPEMWAVWNGQTA
jgi:hypothetical protein